MAAELLAIVEVDWDRRIRCRAAGCGRPVFKAIHVVRESGRVLVLGSDCCGRLFGFGGGVGARPRYGSGTGRKLTDDERAMLEGNTEALIARFEAEAQDEARRTAAARPAPPPTPPAPAPVPPPPPFVAPPVADGGRAWTVADAEASAKARDRANAGDPLGGFAPSQVLAEIERLRPILRAEGVAEELLQRRSYMAQRAIAALRQRRGY